MTVFGFQETVYRPQNIAGNCQRDTDAALGPACESG